MRVISVEDVSKKFILSHDRPKHLADGLRALVHRTPREDFWALRNISFEVEQGEAVGIIGNNGAGKSTMLKLLTGIMKPTKGRIRTRGRCSALIEVGAGFHPEMTGRENIYLNGSILGMTRREIDRKLDAIVSFAELEPFIDMPVKRYSNGMYARLGFAVAAHVEPEVMIVDEVLSVGDVAFQTKCLKRMEAVRSSEGATILFVSHNLIAVQRLCSRAIWIRQGELMGDGPVSGVVTSYLGITAKQPTDRLWEDMTTAPGNDDIRFRRVSVRPVGGSPEEPITTETPVSIEIEYWNLVPDSHLSLTLRFYNDDGVNLFNTSPVNESVWHGRAFPEGLFRSVCHIPGNLLNDGVLTVHIVAMRDGAVPVHTFDSALVFQVLDVAARTGVHFEKWMGVMRPVLDWSTEQLDVDKTPSLCGRGQQ